MATAYLICGLGFGDEGKGATVDFLTRETGAKIVVRYNGGAQAGHNVVLPDGTHHTFSQFGSGMFVPGVKTFLSKYMMVNPMAMMREEAHLLQVGIDDAYDRTIVDSRALIITPFQKAVNVALMKASGKNNSCGMGIGQTREDHIKYGDMGVVIAWDLKYNSEKQLRRKLQFMQDISIKKVEGLSDIPDVLTRRDAIDWCMEAYAKWPAFVGAISYRPEDSFIFEGAQGVLLDEKYGEEGFNTWTNTTFENCYEILAETFPSWGGKIVRIGVLRTYQTRHGDGPMDREVDTPHERFTERHNDASGHQGKFRVAAFSSEALDRAVTICQGVDCIALNHMDVWDMDEWPDPFLIRQIEDQAPIAIEGRGPTAVDRRFTEAWKEKVQEKLYNRLEAAH